MQHVDLEKWQQTVELLADLYGAAAASIVELRGDDFEVVSTSGGGSNPLDKACATFPVDIHSYCRRIMETGAPLYVRQGDQDPEWKDAPPVVRAGVISYLGFPILRPDNTFFGTICVKHDQGTAYSKTFIDTLEQFRDLVQGELALVDRAQRLERMMELDGETGCANRRGLRRFFDRLDAEETATWGVVYLDLDNLKVTNDTHGHEYGDIAINLAGSVLLRNVREGDLAARIGGDEFVLIARVPDATSLDALRGRLVDEFDQARRAVPQLDRIGFSSGTVLLDEAGSRLDLDAVLRHADAAMYDDKRRRRQARP